MLHEFWQNFTHNLFKPLLLFFYLGFLGISLPVVGALGKLEQPLVLQFNRASLMVLPPAVAYASRPHGIPLNGQLERTASIATQATASRTGHAR